MQYKHKTSYVRAEKDKSVCRPCVSKNPDAIKARTEGIRKSIEEGRWIGSQKGVKQSPDTIRKRLESRGMNYNEGPVWTIGKRGEYHAWSRQVKSRDKCCVYCGSKEKLQAHHILSKHKHPEWSLFIDNGITLCHECHWEEHRTNGYL